MGVRKRTILLPDSADFSLTSMGVFAFNIVSFKILESKKGKMEVGFDSKFTLVEINNKTQT